MSRRDVLRCAFNYLSIGILARFRSPLTIRPHRALGKQATLADGWTRCPAATEVMKTRRLASFSRLERALVCPRAGPLVIKKRWILRQHRQHRLPLSWAPARLVE